MGKIPITWKIAILFILVFGGVLSYNFGLDINPLWKIIPFGFLIAVVFYTYHLWLSYLERTSLINDAPTPIERDLPPKTNQKIIRILSIAGGGISGIIPMHVLRHIENQTGKPISELFDVIVGASTGAIPSILLTTPDENNRPRYSADRILKMYNDECRRIFYAPWYHKILTIDGLLGPRYLTLSRQAYVQELLNDVRFDQLLNNVFIPSYGLAHNEPIIFRNWQSTHPAEFNENFFARDILLGSISPPGFFSPIVLRNSKKEKLVLTDSAIYMDNPSLAALLESMVSYPNHQYLLVTLGTGVKNSSNYADRMRTWGILPWLFRIFPVSMTANATYTTTLTRKFFQYQDITHHQDLYFDFNINIPGSGSVSIDDISKQNIRHLNQLGEMLVNVNQEQLAELTRLLVNPTVNITLPM